MLSGHAAFTARSQTQAQVSMRCVMLWRNMKALRGTCTLTCAMVVQWHLEQHCARRADLLQYTASMLPLCTVLTRHANAEMLEGKNISAKADIYSVGIVFWEICSHGRPGLLNSALCHHAHAAEQLVCCRAPFKGQE